MTEQQPLPLPITPENPERLRDCLYALAQSSGYEVLRLEVSVQPSTVAESPNENHVVLTMTHSLGPEHEKALAPLVAKVFFQCLKGMSKGVSVSKPEESP